MGVGDHLIFLLVIFKQSILGDSSTRVVSLPRRILRADVHAYKSKYSKVPEQLVDMHRVFKNKLTDIMGFPDVALGEYDVRMNTCDDEVKDFMLLVGKYKDEQVKWSPTINIWLRRRWVIVRLYKFTAKTKSWSLYRYKNLQQACRRQDLKGLNTMTQ